MSTRSLIETGVTESTEPSENKHPIKRFFCHFSQLRLSDQLSLVVASALGLFLSVLLSPIILGFGMYQACARLFGK
jgi:hypothetical protein